MAFKFNPFTGTLDITSPSAVAPGGDTEIQQYDTDPASPDPETAWVLHEVEEVAGALSHSLAHIGLTTTTTSQTHFYTLKYRTLEGTTVSMSFNLVDGGT